MGAAASETLRVAAPPAEAIRVCARAVRELGPGWKVKDQNEDSLLVQPPWGRTIWQTFPVRIQILTLQVAGDETELQLTGHMSGGLGPLQRRVVQKDLAAILDRIEMVGARGDDRA